MAKPKTSRYKGKVGVSSSNGVLRIRLPRFLYGGEQRFIYTGFKDNSRNRKIVEAKAKQIEADIVFEQFDYSLVRYKKKDFTSEKKNQSFTLVELHQKFILVKKSSVRPGTIRGGYEVMLSHLKESPFSQIIPDIDKTGFAQALADWAIANLTADTSKRLLVQLNACMEWAIASKLVQLKESPFKGVASRTVSRKGLRAERDINPFNLEQRNAIIEHYQSHPKYSHYALFVEFCFSVGCRPSEAIALERENISADYRQVTFTHAFVSGEGGGKSRLQGLKTQEKRTIYSSQSVQRLLALALKQSQNQIVFPAIRGGWFGYATFRKNWKIILAELGFDYRKPYQMRHTFITLCLEAGVDVKDVAKIVGNSPEIIYRHYVENQSKVIIPEF